MARAHSAVSEIKTQSISTYNKSIAPTDCNTFFDKPQPIKKTR